MNARSSAVAAGLLALWTVGLRLVLAPPETVEVVLEVASARAGTMQLFVDDGRGFREPLSARMELVGDTQLRRRRLAVETARLEALRLDPLNAPGEVTLAAVTVAFGGQSRHYAGAELEGSWRAAHQLEASTATEGGLLLRSVGTDPWLVLDEAWPRPSPWRRFLGPPTLLEASLAVAVLPLFGLALAAPRRRFAEVLAVATPLGVFLALNAAALGGWWIRDDPCLVGSALRGGLLAHFYQPEVWRALSGSVLMPWQTFSLGADARVFGLLPRAFYAHQLLAFAVLIVVAYALLRRRTSALSAAAALTVFAASPPSYAVARQLMNRHYLEGTIFFLAALALYVGAVSRRRLGWACGGAALYLLAAAAKEVFVPLVAVLPLIPVGTWRERLRQTAPYVVGALLYVPWRFYMLGWRNSLSGYVARGEGFEPAALPSLVGLDGWRLAVALLFAGAAAVELARRSRGWLAAGVLGTVVVAVPLLPVVAELAPRHFFLPALGAAGLVAVVLERWRTKPGVSIAGALALALFALSSLAASPIWRHHDAVAERYRAEGSFVLESTDNGVLWTTLQDAHYLSCMARLRRDVLGREGGVGFCGDACWCANAFADAPAFRYVEGEPLSFSPGDGACAEERELQVEMSYEASTSRLGWRLGPWEEGRYELLLVGDVQRPEVSIPVPLVREGEAPFALGDSLRVIVKYSSPEGWQTYSPVLTLDPAAGRLSWER